MSPSVEFPAQATPTALTPEAALRSARIVLLAMPVGVVLFWAVAFVMTRAGIAPLAPEAFDARTAATIWTGLALAGLGGALFMRNLAVSRSEEARRTGQPEGVRLGALTSQLIIAGALLEAPGLLAGIIYLYLGLDAVLVYAAPIYLLGVALTLPRAEWFGVDGAVRG